MELHQLRYFVAVAEEGSFTRAAEKLFLAQPSLSVQIRKLEQDVGAKLFERMRRQVVLTAAGEVFLDHAVRALAEMERDASAWRRSSGSAAAGSRSGCCPASARTCSRRCWRPSGSSTPQSR